MTDIKILRGQKSHGTVSVFNIRKLSIAIALNPLPVLLRPRGSLRLKRRSLKLLCRRSLLKLNHVTFLADDKTSIFEVVTICEVDSTIQSATILASVFRRSLKLSNVTILAADAMILATEYATVFAYEAILATDNITILAVVVALTSNHASDSASSGEHSTV